MKKHKMGFMSLELFFLFLSFIPNLKQFYFAARYYTSDSLRTFVWINEWIIECVEVYRFIALQTETHYDTGKN